MRRKDLNRLCEGCGEKPVTRYLTKSGILEWGRTAQCSNCGRSYPKKEIQNGVCRSCRNEIDRPSSVPGKSAVSEGARPSKAVPGKDI